LRHERFRFLCKEQAKSFLCLIRNAKTSLSTGICAASSKNGEFLKMRFFIVAVVAFATMTLDFESFKLNYGLHGMTRSAFTVAAGYAGEEDKLEPAEHSVSTEAAAHPVETNGLSVDSEPAAEVEAPTPEPKKDFCDALREAAESSDIPVAFFARLLWQESRFQAFEVSRVGAQGVAQFMPATAAEVGLDDPFDPFKALPASAKFLRKLHNEFGNLGLAAAAYNAGSGRIQKWLSGRSALPRETRDYVRIITGNNAENWLEESSTLSLHLELPRGAPCEGVGGLSKAKEVATIPVELAPSISDAIRKAEAEARRAIAAKLEAAAKAKTRLALLVKKKSLKEPASSRAGRKLAALSPADRPRRSVHAALAKRLVHSRTKAAQRSRQVDET
jgi:transglycosylase-like protein with SLT domain